MEQTFEDRLHQDLHQFLLAMKEGDERLPECPDVEEKWENIAHSYIPDGIREFNDYPTVSLGWVLYVGIFYLATINLVAFFMYGMDKWKARRSKWRISEATLLVVAVIGGSLGAWLGMKTWHHKTLHKKFRFGVPLILITQILLLIYIFIR